MNARPADTAEDVSPLSPLAKLWEWAERLQARGAQDVDPVTYRYVEALLQRVSGQGPATQRYLHPRIETALARLEARIETRQAPRPTIAKALTDRSLATLVEHLQMASPDDTALLEKAADSSLDALLLQQETDVLRALGQTTPASASPRSELKAMQLFRDTWAKASSDRRVTKVFEHAPRNTGPLNSQTLIIRSLATLRELSPDYANRFVSYVDTLLWLEKSIGSRPAAPRAPGKTTPAPARKTGTRKTPTVKPRKKPIKRPKA